MIRSIALYLSLGGCLAGGFEVALEWAMPLPEVGAIAPTGAPALSQQAVEPASGLARSGFDHTIAGEG